MKDRFARAIRFLDLVAKSFALSVCALFLIALKSKGFNISDTFLYLSTINPNNLKESLLAIFLIIFSSFIIFGFIRDLLQGKCNLSLFKEDEKKEKNL